MSKRIFISLGSLVVLAGTACALSFLDLNFAKAIEEEEDREFYLNTEEQPNIPTKLLEEETHTQELSIQKDDPEVTEQPEPTISQLQPPQEEDKPTTVEISPQPEPEKPPVTPPTPEESPLLKVLDEEQESTSKNETTTEDLQTPKPPIDLKTQQPEVVPKKPAPEPPKEPVPPSQPKKESSSEKPTSKGKPKTSQKSQVQSVKTLWSTDKKNTKTSAVKGMGATNLIRNYSFLLVNKCISGTIWILDYEIAEDDKYPTKFFFGTSAKVAAGIKFDQNKNTYSQTLPTPADDCEPGSTKIVGETDINYGGADHFRTYLWKKNEHGLIEIKDNDSNDVTKWPANQTHNPPYFYYEAQDIQLAYVATDFSGSSNWGGNSANKAKPYMADFAVIEIDFKDQEHAKRMTRDFKATHNNTQDSETIIDFFSQPLLEIKNNSQLYEDSIDIYISGYSQNGLRGRSTGSFDLDNLQASKLTFSSAHQMISTDEEGEILGHADASYSTEPIKEYREDRYLKGLEIVIDHDALENGSLGSLVTDADGKAIGVKSRYATANDKEKDKNKASTVTPFRSKEIKKGGKTIIPKYDLITGSGNTNDKSYKSSILKANKQTYLSKKQNWESKK